MSDIIKTIKIKTSRDFKDEPINLRCDGVRDGAVELTLNEQNGNYSAAPIPADAEGGIITAIVTLPAGEHTLTVREAGSIKPGVTITEVAGDDRIDIKYGDTRFTSYVYTKSLPKPYLGPILTPDGTSYTRLDFTTTEHPHHRSVFFGVGDVTLEGTDIKNIDFWNEPQMRGIQTHEGIEKIVCGAARSSFTVASKWRANDGRPVMDAECTYTFYNQGADCRFIDIELTFKAPYGTVTFGKTKEAGPLGVRLADQLRGDRGGYIENSYGARGEVECWGRSANFCVCGGEANGHMLGIAVFDNEKNERYPTSWHVRDYGLFAANNLYFKGGLKIDEGQSLTYRYRLVFFEGKPDDRNIRIRERFLAYVNPPRVLK